MRAGALACAIALAPIAGQAAEITFDFEATLDAASLDLIGAISPSSFGDISGSFTFDDATSDGNSDPTLGFYGGAVSSLSFSDTDSNSGSASAGDIRINNVPGVLSSYRVDASGAITSAGYGPNVSLSDMTMILSNSSTSVFSDDSLPSTPPSLGDFANKTLILTFLASDGFTQSNAIYELTSLTLGDTPPDDDDNGDPDVGVVPLPAGLPLMLGGLAAFGLLGARRRS